MSYTYAPVSPYDPREPWAKPNSPRVESPPLYTASISGTDTAGTVTLVTPPGPTPSQEIEVQQTVAAKPQIARIDFALPRSSAPTATFTATGGLAVTCTTDRYSLFINSSANLADNTSYNISYTVSA